MTLPDAWTLPSFFLISPRSCKTCNFCAWAANVFKLLMSLSVKSGVAA